jgi:hypothetical protein
MGQSSHLYNFDVNSKAFHNAYVVILGSCLFKETTNCIFGLFGLIHDM